MHKLPTTQQQGNSQSHLRYPRARARTHTHTQKPEHGRYLQDRRASKQRDRQPADRERARPVTWCMHTCTRRHADHAWPLQQVGSAPYLTHITGPCVHGRGDGATEQTGGREHRVGAGHSWLMTHIFNQHLRRSDQLVMIAAVHGHQLRRRYQRHNAVCVGCARIGLRQPVNWCRRRRLANHIVHGTAEVSECSRYCCHRAVTRRGRGRRVRHRSTTAGDTANTAMSFT